MTFIGILIDLRQYNNFSIMNWTYCRSCFKNSIPYAWHVFDSSHPGRRDSTDVLPKVSSWAFFSLIEGFLFKGTFGTCYVTCVQIEGLCVNGLILDRIKWYYVYDDLGYVMMSVITYYVHLKKPFICWVYCDIDELRVRFGWDSRFGHQVEPPRKVIKWLGVDGRAAVSNQGGVTFGCATNSQKAIK